MIITKHRQLYYKQKGSGLGYINKEIIGNGIFTDTMKMLGRKLWSAGKTLFKNKILPNIKVATKYGLETGKQLIEDNKKEMGEIISKQSKNLLKNLLDKSGNKSKQVKQVISNTKEDLSNVYNKNKENIQQNSREVLNKLLYGEGLKVIKNSRKKKFK
jgi:gas vesicle protein